MTQLENQPARIFAGPQRRTKPKGMTDLFSRGFLARLARIRQGTLTLIAPDRAEHRFGVPGTEPTARLVLHDRRVARRLALGGSIAVAESYMAGDWDSPDLTALVELAILNEHAMGLDHDGPWVKRALELLRHLTRDNSRRGSRRNISYHYDLGNDFYARWLDPGMTYSAALYESDSDSLDQAQAHKYRHVAELLDLRPGQNLLEIGCGWGGFAELAAGRHEARVTGLTLSQQQRDYAVARLAAGGLADRTDIRLEDYRDVAGTYDRIASIEMFEAVGEAHWPLYFERLRSLLVPGGAAVLQVITIAEERFAAYRHAPDFIQRYIFPGGMLPTRTALGRLAEDAGLRFVEGRRFGPSYGKTLAVWQERFQAAWPSIARLGFDRRFKRMWEYYLGYCEAGFRTGSLDVGLYRLERADGIEPA